MVRLLIEGGRVLSQAPGRAPKFLTPAVAGEVLEHPAPVFKRSAGERPGVRGRQHRRGRWKCGQDEGPSAIPLRPVAFEAERVIPVGLNATAVGEPSPAVVARLTKLPRRP